MWKSLEQLLATTPGRASLLRRVAASLTVESAETALLETYPKLAGRVRVQSVQNGVLGLTGKTPIDVQETAMRKSCFMRLFKERGLAVRDVKVTLERRTDL